VTAALDPTVVDLDRLAAWMDERGLESGPLADPELIAGGTQNILLRFRRGTRTFVLRAAARSSLGGDRR